MDNERKSLSSLLNKAADYLDDYVRYEGHIDNAINLAYELGMRHGMEEERRRKEALAAAKKHSTTNNGSN